MLRPDPQELSIRNYQYLSETFAKKLKFNADSGDGRGWKREWVWFWRTHLSMSQNISIYSLYLKYPKMVLQRRGAQDIHSFQIRMKPWILPLTSHLGLEAAQNGRRIEDRGIHADLERINISNNPVLKRHFGIFRIHWTILAYPKTSSSKPNLLSKNTLQFVAGGGKGGEDHQIIKSGPITASRGHDQIFVSGSKLINRRPEKWRSLIKMRCLQRYGRGYVCTQSTTIYVHIHKLTCVNPRNKTCTHTPVHTS